MQRFSSLLPLPLLLHFLFLLLLLSSPIRTTSTRTFPKFRKSTYRKSPDFPELTSGVSRNPSLETPQNNLVSPKSHHSFSTISLHVFPFARHFSQFPRQFSQLSRQFSQFSRRILAESPIFWGKEFNGFYYNGGKVAANGVTVYLIWYGNWTLHNSTKSLIRTFVQSLGQNSTAPDIPSVTGYWGLATQFYSLGPGAAYVSKNVSLSGEEYDDVSMSVGSMMNNTVVQEVVGGAIEGGLPLDERGFYYVITAPEVEVPVDDCVCAYKDYLVTSDNISLPYSWVTYPNSTCLGSCGPFYSDSKYVSPNNDTEGDIIVNYMAMTAIGMAMNPDGQGWTLPSEDNYLDATFYCTQQFGTVMTNANGGNFNVYGNGNTTFLISKAIDITTGNCSIQAVGYTPPPNPPPPPPPRPPPRPPPSSPPPKPSPPPLSYLPPMADTMITYSPPPTTSPPLDGDEKSKSKMNFVVIGVAIPIGAIFLGLLAFFIFWMCRKKKSSESQKDKGPALGTLASSHPPEGGHVIQLPGGHFILALTFDQIQKSTNNFSEENLLGKGGYGMVYKGVSLDGGQIWAVKRGRRRYEGEVNREFEDEVKLIAPMAHKNLVGLKGFCAEKGEQILVYEFVEHGTLKQHLMAHPSKGGVPLSFAQRLEIALGSSRGLQYLHSFAKESVVHRDVKSENILLDANMQAKVADFGLLKPLTDDQTHVSTRVAGTIGYMDPEYRSLNQVSTKSDVYSFGVVLMELITGRHPIVLADSICAATGETDEKITLVRWVNIHMAHSKLEDIVDPNLNGDYPIEASTRFIYLSQLCTQTESELRPTMEEVTRRLEEIKAGGNVNWDKEFKCSPSPLPKFMQPPENLSNLSTTLSSDESFIPPVSEQPGPR